MAQLGLKDLHIAILHKDMRNELTYDAPVPVVDVISANINPTINTAEIYADDRLSELLPIIGKIEVEMETADLPLKVRAKIMGNEFENGVLIEKGTDVPPYLALGFKSLKSNGKYRYVWLLKGMAQSVIEEYATKKDSVDVKTPKTKFIFMSRIHDDKLKHTADEDGEGFTGTVNWFKKVPGDTTPVVEVNKSALTAAISDAEELLGEATVGTDPGEYPQAAYDEFSAAIDAAQAVVDDADATQGQVDAAVLTLAAATSTFEAAVITE